MKVLLLLVSLSLAALIAPAAAQGVWTLRTTPEHEWAGHPAGKAGVYLVPTHEPAASGQYYLRSTDTVTWERVALPSTAAGLADSAASLVCFNGRFLGWHHFSGMWYSDDGLTGTPCYTAAPVMFPAGIAFGNDVWIMAMQNGRVLRSTTNAASWTEVTTPAADFAGVAFGAGKFIAVSEASSFTSSDGLTWTPGPLIAGTGLCYDAGLFRTTTHTSPDGLAWTPLTKSAGMPAACLYVRSGGGGFLTWSTTPGDAKLFTATTDAWSPPVTPPSPFDQISDAAFCGDHWIAVTDASRVLTSPSSLFPPLVAPELHIGPGPRLWWQSQTGRSYRLQRSANLGSWTDFPEALPGTGEIMEWLSPAPVSAPQEFFRLQVR